MIKFSIRFESVFSFSKTNDMTNDTKTMVADLENSIILGVILVVVVLLFFLGVRNALFVGIAIPLSMFMSFMILQAAGVSLNIMVLFLLIGFWHGASWNFVFWGGLHGIYLCIDKKFLQKTQSSHSGFRFSLDKIRIYHLIYEEFYFIHKY